jgi:hypothetical protein
MFFGMQGTLFRRRVYPLFKVRSFNPNFLEHVFAMKISTYGYTFIKCRYSVSRIQESSHQGGKNEKGTKTWVYKPLLIAF